MSAPYFVYDGADLTVDATVRLAGPEGHHAADVQRLRVGESLVLTTGSGVVADGTVAGVERGALSVLVDAVRTVPAPVPHLVVVQAIPKGDRGELAVAMLTEVGVDVVVPWAAARCVARWAGERGDRASAKWAAVARESAKQSRRAHFPEVAGLATTDDVGALVGAAACAVVLHEGAEVPVASVALPADGDVVIVVGPEGGLTDDEVDALVAAGAGVVRLGPTVLRTSTAGVAAAAVLLSRTPRWAELS